MNATVVEILTIGDEVLSGDILDTNTQFLAEACWLKGLAVEYHSAVRDEETRIAEAIRLAASRADVVLVTGGLGPTADDFTVEVAAKVFGVDLVEDDKALENLNTLMQKRGRTVTSNNRKQALVFAGGTVFINKLGTAPGCHYCYEGTHFYFMPGVPREMKPLFEEAMLPHFLSLNPSPAHYESLVLKTFGATESEIDRSLADLLDSRTGIGNVRIGYRFSFPEVFVKLSVWEDSREAAQKNLADVVRRVEEKIGHFIYACGAKSTLEGEVVKAFGSQGKTIALAESCTGGIIANRLTNVPGSSQVFLGGVVSYANAVKESVLGVSPQILREHGAVSEECALAMVRGIQRLTHADSAAAITGIAGPGGGSAEKPVGTVFIATLLDGVEHCQKFHFAFSRTMFKEICAAVVFKRLLEAARAGKSASLH